MGGDQRRRRAGADVTRQLLCRGQLRQLRGGLGGLIGKGIAFCLRLSGQKIQQLRLFGGVWCSRLASGAGSCLGLLCGQSIGGLPLHRGNDVLAGLGGAAVEGAAGLLQAAGRLAGRVDVEDLGLRLLLRGHLCLLQVEDDLLRVGGGRPPWWCNRVCVCQTA